MIKEEQTKNLILITFMMVASYASSANEGLAFKCNNCSIESSKALAISKNSNEIVYTYDFINDRILKFRTFSEYDSEFGFYRKGARSLPVEQENVDYFNNASIIYQEFGALKTVIEVDISYGVWDSHSNYVSTVGWNAYSVTTNSSQRNLISQHIQQTEIIGATGALSTLISNITSAAENLIYGDDALSIDFVVKFPDGSTAVFEYSTDSTANLPTLISGSPIDENNNTVPTQANGGLDSGQEYNFNNDEQGIVDFINYVRSLGIPVTTGGGSITRCVFYPGYAVCTTRTI